MTLVISSSRDLLFMNSGISSTSRITLVAAARTRVRDHTVAAKEKARRVIIVLVHNSKSKLAKKGRRYSSLLVTESTVYTTRWVVPCCSWSGSLFGKCSRTLLVCGVQIYSSSSARARRMEARMGKERIQRFQKHTRPLASTSEDRRLTPRESFPNGERKNNDDTTATATTFLGDWP